MNQTNCLFCKIVQGVIPAEIIYENEYAVVIKDIDPKAPVHLLAIPRNHYRGMHEVPPEESWLFGGLFEAVTTVIKLKGLDSGGYRLVVNSGESAGQAVGHIHVHILSGRTLHWPPG
jgi:histidine triad (HIT) family protein